METSATTTVTSTEEPVVKIVGLTKSYQMGEVTIPALRGVNMEVFSGQLVSIVGPSGCGKTTLLNMIGGLDKPTEGKIFVNGNDMTTLNDKDLTRIRRHEIGFVFQSYNLLPVLSAFENVELPMLIAGVNRETRSSRTRELLQTVGLDDRRNHRPDELSGGERQRVAIARSMANNPSILLADEPTGDLDTENGQMVLNLLKKVNKSGQTVLIVTHDMTLADQTEKVIVLRDGLVEKILDN
ncbi:MAG: ABC transporter ATP-binding protein [Candidatus Hodarchaeales archaeon]|jgi:putative ABC transport system ATP-binding protein